MFFAFSILDFLPWNSHSLVHSVYFLRRSKFWLEGSGRRPLQCSSCSHIGEQIIDILVAHSRNRLFIWLHTYREVA